MQLSFYQVDAFADGPFAGNPAVVMPLDEWLADDILLNIAAENNLAETAFFMPSGKGDGSYDLRWFSPTVEVDLCGHATLASAYVLMNILQPGLDEVRFNSQSGPLFVKRDGDRFVLDFPARAPSSCSVPDGLIEAMGKPPQEILFGERDYLLVYDNAKDVLALEPDFTALKSLGLKGFLATAPGRRAGEDIVSRCFFPAYGVDEDTVTGSAHCVIAPYWQKRLGKDALTAWQGKGRGGVLYINVSGDRVKLEGECYLTIEGTFNL